MPRSNSSNWSVNDQITAARLQDLNEDADVLFASGSDRLRVYSAVSGTPLKIDIGAGAFRVGDTHGTYAGATDISVTNTATNYVQIDATGTIQISTSGWTSAYTRLAAVVCSGGVITSITLWKVDAVGGLLSGSTQVNTQSLSGTLTMTTADKKYQNLNPNGANRNVVLPSASMSEGDSFFIKNNATTVTTEYLVVLDGATELCRLQRGDSCLAVYSGSAWFIMLYEDDDDPIFGDASDGDVTLGVDTTITRDMYYKTLDLATFKLNTAGFRVYARHITGTSGKIKAPTGSVGGNGAVGGAAGSAGAGGISGSLPAARAGAAGGAGGSGYVGTGGGGGSAGSPGGAGVAETAGLGSSNSVAGGVGGASGSPGSIAPGGPAGASATTTQLARQHLETYRLMATNVGATWTAIGSTSSAGGGGGGGGGSGNGSPSGATGGGGAGSGGVGGFFFVAAESISGSWTIESIGGAGGTGGAGQTGSYGPSGGGAGGSGGNGGSGVLVYKKSTWSGSAVLTGGAAGTGGAGAGGSPAGGNGNAGNAGTMITIVIT